MKKFVAVSTALLVTLALYTGAVAEKSPEHQVDPFNSNVLVQFDSFNCTEDLKPTCVKCKPGTYANDSETAECSCCKQLGLDGSCVSVTGNHCTACPAGQFQNKQAQNACSLCPAGTSQPKKGQVSCAPCEAGKHQSREGQPACIPCKPGTHQPEPGWPVCFDCQPGSYSNESGAVNCSFCEPGTYQNLKAETMCLPCHRGTYCWEVGCQICNPCPRGEETKNTGMTNCTLCAKGYAKATDDAVLCEQCAPGSYSDEFGQSLCKRCPAGSYCQRGAVDPVKCQSYEVCPEGSSEPTECEPPWYKKVDESTCKYSDTFIAVVTVSSAIVFLMAAAMSWRLYRASRHQVLEAATTEERAGLLTTGNSGADQREPSYTGL